MMLKTIDFRIFVRAEFVIYGNIDKDLVVLIELSRYC